MTTPPPLISQLPARGATTPAVVAVGRLRAHPRNVRRDLGDLRVLAESIRVQGVLVPLIVQRHGEGFEVLAGHRRLAAATLAGRRRLPVLIVAAHDEDEAIELMLSENLHRAGLSAPEKRAAVRTLVTEFGYTPTAVAAKLGVAPSTVAAWLRAPDQHGAAARRVRRHPVTGRRVRPPTVPPSAVAELCQRWSGRAPTALLDQLRALLGGWTPTPDTESVSEHVLAQVAELDPDHTAAVPQLALRIGCHPRLVERARRALRTATARGQTSRAEPPPACRATTNPTTGRPR